MNGLKKIRLWFRAVFQKQALDAQMDEEISSHIEMQTHANIARGMAPDQARDAALRQFGWIESTKERCREQRGTSWFEELGRDIRQGLLFLRKYPGSTAVAMLTLGLGLGASTIVFGVAKSILFRPLGIDEPDQLVWLKWVNHSTGKVEESFSWVDFTDLQSEARSLNQLALVNWPGVNWEEGDRVKTLTSLAVTPSVFDLLRIHPFKGRFLLGSDAEPASEPVAMISYELWQSHFNSDPEILNQKLRLDDKVRSVVGVLPPQLEFPLGRGDAAPSGPTIYGGRHDIWLPFTVEGEDKTARGHRGSALIARLKTGSSITAVRSELANLAKRWAKEYPDTNSELTLEPVAYRDKVLGATRRGIHLLTAAVAAVLLICCVNLANLLLARGVSRQRELALHSALGAGRGRLLRFLLCESLLLSLGGGLLGIILAQYGVQLIRMFGPAEVPFIREVRLDWTVVGLTIALCFVTALVFGLAPALWQSRIEPGAVLKTGSRVKAGVGIVMWQRWLLIGQIALVLSLLASASLLLESFRRLMAVDLGYQPGQVLALDLGNWGLPTNEDGVRLYRAIKSRIAELPGVEAVGTIQSTPLTGKWTWEEKAQVFGRSLPLAEQPSLGVTFIAFDYFQAMRIPLIEGRFFRDSELRDDGYAPTAILNQAAAARLFPGETAVGKRFSISSSPERFYEVVGVVKDTRDLRIEQKPQPRFYLLYTHGGSQVVVRSVVPPKAMIPLLRDALRGFTRHVIVNSIRSMPEIVSDTVAERRFLIAMLTTYAMVAIGVAAAGIFSVASYQVLQRTGEFGIRLALGATPASLMRLVMGQAMRLAVTGLAVGLMLSFGIARLLASHLFGLSWHDPVLLATVILLVLIMVLLASLLPARRAARVDPVVTLRNE